MKDYSQSKTLLILRLTVDLLHCNACRFPDLLNFCLKLAESADQPRSDKKRRALGLSYLIDENPPWYICLLLGFQVSIESYHQKSSSKILD